MSQSQTLTDTMTAEEFLQWCHHPDHAGGRYELEDGRIVEMPSPSEMHGAICWLVAHLIGKYFVPRSGYLLTNDTGLIVKRRPDTVRGPDIMGFLERPAFEDLKFAFVERLPIVVVEVLSPSDRPGKTTRRVNQYLKRGIPLVWVVDPEDRNMIVYTQNQESITLDETDDLTGGEILPGFRCKVSEFFAWPTTTTDTP